MLFKIYPLQSNFILLEKDQSFVFIVKKLINVIIEGTSPFKAEDFLVFLITQINHNSPLLKMISDSPSFILSLIKLLKTTDMVTEPLKKRVLQHKNNEGKNLLMLVVNNPEALVCLLDFIYCSATIFNKAEQREFFTSLDFSGRNLVMHAVFSRTKSITILINFISENSKLFKSENFSSLFTWSDANTMNILVAIMHYQPKYLVNFLSFLSDHHSLIGLQFIRELFAQRSIPQKNNLLMQTLFYHSEPILQQLLTFIAKNRKIFNREIIKDLFLGKNTDNKILLNLTAYFRPSLTLCVANFTSLYVDNQEDLILATLNSFNFNQELDLKHIDEFIEKYSEILLRKIDCSLFDENPKPFLYTTKKILECYKKRLQENQQTRQETLSAFTSFFKKSNQRDQKIEAISKLLIVIDQTSENCRVLRNEYPVLQKGKLGHLWEGCLKALCDREFYLASFKAPTLTR